VDNHNEINFSNQLNIQIFKVLMVHTNIVLAFMVPLILLRSSLNRLTDDISASTSASVHFPLQKT